MPRCTVKLQEQIHMHWGIIKMQVNYTHLVCKSTYLSHIVHINCLIGLFNHTSYLYMMVQSYNHTSYLYMHNIYCSSKYPLQKLGWLWIPYPLPLIVEFSWLSISGLNASTSRSGFRPSILPRVPVKFPTKVSIFVIWQRKNSRTSLHLPLLL